MREDKIVQVSEPDLLPGWHKAGNFLCTYAAVHVTGSLGRFAWAVLWLWPVAIYHYFDHVWFQGCQPPCQHKLFRWVRR